MERDEVDEEKTLASVDGIGAEAEEAKTRKRVVCRQL
jgi:hypothetical protein